MEKGGMPPDQAPPPAYNAAPPPAYPAGAPPPGGYPPGQQQGYPPPAQGGYPAGPQQPGYPPAGGQAAYPPGAQGGYPQTAPQQMAPATNTTVVVQAGGTCPHCGVGYKTESYTTCGIILAICFFPLGLLCCLLMKETKCSHCGQPM